jgi:tetratricopeptide (TPR) repeat protein
LAAVAGGVLAIGKFIRQPSAEWFLVLGLAFLVLLAMVYFYLTCPYFSCVKAFYGLCGLTPLCAFAVLGLDTVYRHIRKLRVVVFVLFAVWAMNSYMSFWISRDDALRSSGTISLLHDWRPDVTRRLAAHVAENPNDIAARCTLIDLTQGPDPQQAARHIDFLLAENPPEAQAQLHLATALERQGRISEATEHARQAAQLAPAFAPAIAELAILLVKQGDFAGAARVSVMGLRLDPFSAQLRLAFGMAEVMQGNKISGIKQISLALKLNPDLAESQGSSLTGCLDSISSDALTPELRVDFATILVDVGNSEKAINYLRPALDLQPQNPEAHVELALALTAKREIKQAVNEYKAAIRLDPNLPVALNNLAWLLATSSDNQLRNGPEAVHLALHACELTGYREAVMIGTLAAAYAEAGEFDKAVDAAKRASDLALSLGQTALAQKNQDLLLTYRDHKTWRE